MDLRKIDFGRDTAEFDTHLSEYFLQTPAHDRIAAAEKSIITGRKGTGKTALLKYFSDTENTAVHYVHTIQASHSTYVKIDENLRTFTTQIKNLDSSFKLGWLFATLLCLLDRLIAESTMFVTKEEKDLYEFAKTEYRYDKDDPIAAISGYVFSWIRDLKKIGPVERNAANSDVQVFDEPRILQLIKAAVSRMNDKGKRVFLFYDKLDERWDGSPLYTGFLQGLLLAVREMKALGLDLAPVILLRDDIFDAVTKDFQHIDHFRMEIQPIEWDEHSLMELLALRVSKSLAKGGTRVDGMNAEELWRIAFPEDMPARKQAVPPYAYMIERTLFRPRDIVLFANLARDEALKHSRWTVSNADLIEAEQQYSRMKLHDLASEWSYKYPHIELLLKSFRKKTIGFEPDDLRLAIMEARETIASPPPWMQDSEDDIIRNLYLLGFLSYTKRGGVLRGTRVIHSAIDPDPDSVLEQSRIYISPIFRQGLELRDH